MGLERDPSRTRVQVTRKELGGRYVHFGEKPRLYDNVTRPKGVSTLDLFTPHLGSQDLPRSKWLLNAHDSLLLRGILCCVCVSVCVWGGSR